MFWKWLDRLTSLTFLLLAVIISIKLTNNSLDNSQVNKILSEISRIEQNNTRVMSSNLSYLEGRINSYSSNQDSYQVGTSRRIDVLEQRMQNLEKKRVPQRIVNNNNSTAIVNNSDNGASVE